MQFALGTDIVFLFSDFCSGRFRSRRFLSPPPHRVIQVESPLRLPQPLDERRPKISTHFSTSDNRETLLVKRLGTVLHGTGVSIPRNLTIIESTVLSTLGIGISADMSWESMYDRPKMFTRRTRFGVSRSISTKNFRVLLYTTTDCRCLV